MDLGLDKRSERWERVDAIPEVVPGRLMTTRRSAASSDCQRTPVVPRTHCLASLSRPCRSKPALASRILKPRSSKMEWQYEEVLSGDHRWLFHRMVGETVRHPSIDSLLAYPPENVFIESCTGLRSRGLSVRYSCHLQRNKPASKLGAWVTISVDRGAH